ncbi:hypothetical protein ACOMHN_045768 [Nucella lapillus]
MRRMTTNDILELDHSKLTMAVHEGMLLPEYQEPISEHLTKIKAMDIRDNDILLFSFSNSGTHWTYRVIDMLIRGQATFVQRNPDSMFIDVQNIDAISTLGSPRVLVTHLPFQLLPAQIQDKRTKIVHVYRNPRAVLSSFYCRMKGSGFGAQLGLGDLTFDKASAMFFSDKMTYSGWFNLMDSVNTFKKKNPQHPIFEMTYEEMKQNCLETVSRLGQFVGGQGASGTLCAEIAEACSFDNQKVHEASSKQNQNQLKFYRKGDTNDWKNHVTVAVEEKFEQILQERAENCPYSAKYCRK